MSEKQPPQSEDLDVDTKEERIIDGIVIAVFFALVFAYVIYISQSVDVEAVAALGQRGDFIGGFMNPIIGLATIYLITISIKIQRRELQASLKELQASNAALIKQSFENSFFSWINTYQKLLESVRYDDPVPSDGRHALQQMFSGNFRMDQTWSVSFRDQHKLPNGTFATKYDVEYWRQGVKIDERRSIVQTHTVKYRALFERERYQFDGLYRTLYRLFKWVDEHEQLTTEDKWFYIAIVRAQLSWIELVYLLYNCLTTGKNLRKYANKYALFDNLGDSGELLLPIIRADSEYYGLASTAFQSVPARHKLGLD